MPDPRRTLTPVDPVSLDAHAEVTPEDIERAKVAADRDGPSLLSAMLHALPDEGR